MNEKIAKCTRLFYGLTGDISGLDFRRLDYQTPGVWQVMMKTSDAEYRAGLGSTPSQALDALETKLVEEARARVDAMQKDIAGA